MSTKTITELKTELTTAIRSGTPGNPANSSAADTRALITNVLDSVPNIKDGGLLFEEEVGYSGAVTPVSAGAFVPKSYVDPAVYEAGYAPVFIPDVAQYNRFSFTAVSGPMTIAPPPAGGTNFKRIVFRFYDNGTGQTITFDPSANGYFAANISLSITTTPGEYTEIEFEWFDSESQWGSVAINSASGGGGGSGTVNSGTASQLAYYAANGTAVSGLATANNSVLVTNGSGVPSISSTLPTGLTIPGYLPLGGGTMTGALVLNADPVLALGAVTKQYAESLVVGLWDDRGNFDASAAAYPSSGGSGTAGAILKGDIWTVSVAGNGLEAGDTIRALVDSPGTTPANWAAGQNNIGYTPITNVLNSGQILVGNSSNVATAVTMSGDATLNNSGVITIGALKVDNSKIADGTIDLAAKVTGVLPSANGGTGQNNGSSTISIGGSWTHSDPHTIRLNTSANTNITLPTTGTLATLAGTETLTNKTLGSATKVLLGSDATGDIYYNGGSGTLTRAAAGADGTFVRYASGVPVASTLVLPNAITANRIVFGSTTNTYGSASSLAFDSSNASLTVGTGAASANDIISAQKDQNAVTRIMVVNANNNSSAFSGLTVGNLNTSFSLYLFPGGFSPTGFKKANQVVLTTQSAAAGGIAIESTSTTSGADIVLATAATQRLNISKDGLFTVWDGGNIALGTVTGSILAASASQKLGVWGATPIVQPTTAFASATFAANGGPNTLTDTDTFDGYTIKQLARIIRSIGLAQ